MSDSIASASTSTSALSANLPTAEEILGWNRDRVKGFLQRKQDILDLDDDDIDKIYNQRIKGNTFLTLTQDDLLSIGITLGSAKEISHLIKQIQGDQPAGKKKIFKMPKIFKSIGEKAFNPPKELNLITEIFNQPETIESLHKYETRLGQAQRFLDRIGQNFRWPTLMGNCDRGTAFFYLADETALKFDDEAGLNLIFFFDNLDKGTFDAYKDKWVLIYKQEVIKYGILEYTSKELDDLEDNMPGAIYLAVDKSHRDGLVKSPSARTVSVQRANQEHMV